MKPSTSSARRPRGLSIQLPATKPRNPFVAAAMRRPAGTHGTGNTRQQARQALRRELAQCSAEPRSGP
jgi:hypothetical protein